MNEQSELPEVTTSDAELLNRYQSGDRDAALEIYTRYAQRLVFLTKKQSSEQLSAKVDADEIVQSVFRTFFRRASDGNYQLPDGDELWGLFLVISLNKIRKKSEYFQAAKRDTSRTKPIRDNYPATDQSPVEILRITVDELISMLPEEYQGVIRDRIQGFEVVEISDRNKISRRTTERVLQSFRQQLKKELEEGT